MGGWLGAITRKSLPSGATVSSAPFCGGYRCSLSTYYSPGRSFSSTKTQFCILPSRGQPRPYTPLPAGLRGRLPVRAQGSLGTEGKTHLASPT